MSEWWTYRPSDFLMYSPRSWGRLLEALHRELWPAQVIVALLAAAVLVVAWRRPRDMARIVCGVLAVAWAWLAWDFFWNRLGQISTGAPWMAAAAALQALLLAVGASRQPAADGGSAPRAAGLSLAAIALLLFPLLAPLRGAGWAQAELTGLTPDATALFTIGLLLALPVRLRGWLLPVPVALLAIGLTMQWLLLTR
jgi:hypothetical protein